MATTDDARAEERWFRGIDDGQPPRYRDFEPCEKGRACLAHVTHPCDNCGRIAGRYPAAPTPTEDHPDA